MSAAGHSFSYCPTAPIDSTLKPSKITNPLQPIINRVPPSPWAAHSKQNDDDDGADLNVQLKTYNSYTIGAYTRIEADKSQKMRCPIVGSYYLSE